MMQREQGGKRTLVDDAHEPESADRPAPGKASRVASLAASWQAEAAPIASQLGIAPAIHVDDEARARTEAAGARGVAVDDAVYLHPERIAPGTPEGRAVLVHELVHIAQARNPGDSPRDDAEAEADEIAASGGVRAPVASIRLDEPAADVGAKQRAPAPAGQDGLVPDALHVTFGDTIPGADGAPRTVRLVNRGARAAELTELTIEGPHASDFRAHRIVPVQVGPGEPCELEVRFKPSQLGMRHARLVIAAGVVAPPIQVMLVGTASQERWNRAARSYLEHDAKFRSVPEASPGYGPFRAQARRDGYSYDEADRVYRDLLDEHHDDWRPARPQLKPYDDEFNDAAAALYPELRGEPTKWLQFLRYRYRKVRDLLDGKTPVPAARRPPEVPTEKRLLAAALDEQFGEPELSVLWALYKRDTELMLLGDGSQLTRRQVDQRMVKQRLDAGRALTTPGGTLGYAIGGLIWPDDEDKKLAAAGFGSGVGNFVGFGMKALNNWLLRRKPKDGPMMPHRPMEPDKQTTIVERRFGRNHWSHYAIDAPGWDPQQSRVYGGHAAAAVEAVHRQIEDGALRGGDLRAVLGALAQRRRAIAELMEEKPTQDFGRPRELGPRGQAVTPLGGKYEPWKDRIPERSRGRLSDGKEVELTRKWSELGRDGTLEHTNPAHLERILAECEVLYQRAIDPSTSVRDTVRTVGRLHWWLAHAMPYHRGSAGITDMLTKLIFLRRGIQIERWRRGVSPDLDAMSAPSPEAFGDHYHELFVGPPKS